MRILGIDYGDARIGLVISDPSETIATPLSTYQSVSMRKDVDYIAKVCLERDVKLIVLGLPKNMDGSIGDRATKTMAFGKVIEKVTGISVEYKDERLSTVSAEKSLLEGNMRRDKRKEVIDSVAAQIILQSYLDSKKNKL